MLRTDQLGPPHLEDWKGAEPWLPTEFYLVLTPPKEAAAPPPEPPADTRSLEASETASEASAPATEAAAPADAATECMPPRASLEPPTDVADGAEVVRYILRGVISFTQSVLSHAKARHERN